MSLSLSSKVKTALILMTSQKVHLRLCASTSSLRPLRGEATQGPHSSVFARLASGAFYEVILSPTFYATINIDEPAKTFRPVTPAEIRVQNIFNCL
jgi:hypothetical protein